VKWKGHGALRYRECICSDVNIGKVIPFPQPVQMKVDERVAFRFINHSSREAPDRWRTERGSLIDVDLPPRPLFDDHAPMLYEQILNYLLRGPLGLDERRDNDPVRRAVLEGHWAFLEPDGDEAATP
jgi:hypothetical protein